ncbi:MAG TPA: 23S rRNA (pseudouridine(1915)-N(3))-methyltransferase RlmH [Bacteroidia bacterium]|nr:23S rRNA (pseudouridine(1915)-N(3))-methyltransferase RlmH [Bacteroidia bacterium]
MKITFTVIGKTTDDYIKTGFQLYEKRLNHYVNFELKIIPELKNNKNLSTVEQKKSEGNLLLKELKPTDLLILLDENGKTYNSIEFSDYVQHIMNKGIKNVVFAIGGPYGFSDEIYKRANDKIALSRMTFSHQLVRLIFAEQLYRAMTILKKEPYHHI